MVNNSYFFVGFHMFKIHHLEFDVSTNSIPKRMAKCAEKSAVVSIVYSVPATKTSASSSRARKQGRGRGWGWGRRRNSLRIRLGFHLGDVPLGLFGLFRGRRLFVDGLALLVETLGLALAILAVLHHGTVEALVLVADHQLAEAVVLLLLLFQSLAVVAFHLAARHRHALNRPNHSPNSQPFLLPLYSFHENPFHHQME